MTISIWRFSHLALAISSFLFIAIASLTGIILAFEPVAQKIEYHNSADLENIKLSDAIYTIQHNYSGITDVKVDDNNYLIVNASDHGENIEVYADPVSGKQIGFVKKQSDFFRWVTNLHRSLFLQSTGRFFILLTSFLLMLLAISGSILIIKRQKGLRRFFSKIVKDNFFQYYHVLLGRLSLILILIISGTGIILSLEKFGFTNDTKIIHTIDFDSLNTSPAIGVLDFSVFKNINLSQVKSIEFPFSEDVEDFYLLKLNDRELTVNQITGEVLSEKFYPLSTKINSVSMNLHTGRTNVIWAIILGIACINILFFIYSGFKITFKRRSGIIKNKFKSSEVSFIILVGSENGTTMKFAKEIHKQIIKAGQKSFITELNNYKVFPEAKYLLVFTATYGLGDAPQNAKKIQLLLKQYPQPQHLNFSVVGFGSHAYKDFCKFAFELNNLLTEQTWAKPLLELHTVNDRSLNEFNSWLELLTQKTGIPFKFDESNLYNKYEKINEFKVTEKILSNGEDESFIVKLKPLTDSKFRSGDLLAIFPNNNYIERQYSIGKIDNQIQLSVKYHVNGLGSEYLKKLKIDDIIKAKIISNTHFYFPTKTKKVIMVSNGTGIAPFLGMINDNRQSSVIELYCGFRNSRSFSLYKNDLEKALAIKKLDKLNIAFSREGIKTYVSGLLKNESDKIVKELEDKTVIMICGSLSMQKDVIELLEKICLTQNKNSLSFYQSRGQILMDCY